MDIFDKNIDLEVEWNFLENILNDIFTLEINIGNNLWMEMYTRIYNIYVNNNKEYHLTIYNNISNLLLEKIKCIYSKIDNLEKYCNQWNNLKNISLIIVNIFRYLKRFFFKSNNLSDFESLILKYWREEFNNNSKILWKDLNYLLEKYRENENYDKLILSQFISTFIELDNYLENADKYVDSFNTEFYQIFNDYIIKNISEYLDIKLNLLYNKLLPYEFYINLNIELKREIYLITNILPNIENYKNNNIQIVLNYIRKYKDNLEENIEQYILNKNKEILIIIYNLLNKIESIDKLVEIFGKFIKKTFNNTLNEFINKEKLEKIPIFNIIEDYYDKYKDIKIILTEYFDNNSKLLRERDMIIKNFFKNTIKEFTTSELLCYLLEDILKNKKKLLNNDLEEDCDRILELYKYISDYDLFLETYRIGLSKRLLSNKSDIEMEKTIVSKLKILSGSTLTFKIESMIKDYMISSNNEIITKEEISKEFNIDLNVLVLNKGNWPILNSIKFNLNGQIQKFIDYYDNKYCKKNMNKKLEWMLLDSKLVLVFNTCKKKNELILNTLQGCILLLFNENNSYSVKELVNKLDCDYNEIIKALFGLTRGKYKILNKDINDNNFEYMTKLTINDKFSTQYSKAPYKINIPSSPPNSINMIEKKKIDEDIYNTRKHSIDCALVRIMKSRGQLYHNELISECNKQLINLFTPDLKQIKKEIEQLIDNEYLERVENEKNLYRYLA